MSADVLRQAAALMRERAEAIYAPDGSEMVNPWREDWVQRPDVEDADGEYIASWHPAVALAVADWLDATAARIDAGRDPKDGGRRNHGWRGSREALAVARVYLGESA